MALVSCAECGHQISDKASTCPNCGAPTAIVRHVAPTKVLYDPGTDTFAGTMPLVVKLAMQAIQQLGWKVSNANEVLGLVNFETGMSWGSWSGVSCSVNIDEVSQYRFSVKGTAKQSLQGGQILALNIGGEAEGKLRKAIEKMKELAAERQPVVSPAPALVARAVQAGGQRAPDRPPAIAPEQAVIGRRVGASRIDWGSVVALIGVCAAGLGAIALYVWLHPPKPREGASTTARADDRQQNPRERPAVRRPDRKMETNCSIGPSGGECSFTNAGSNTALSSCVTVHVHNDDPELHLYDNAIDSALVCSGPVGPRSTSPPVKLSFPGPLSLYQLCMVRIVFNERDTVQWDRFCNLEVHPAGEPQPL